LHEWWYAIHFTAYAGTALAWFHMIPDGNELIANVNAADYWRALFFFALAIVIWYRLAWPVINTFRYGIRVTEVIHEGPGVVSLRLKGRGLDRLGTKAGQFYFWRFFTKGFWYTQHPFSLSERPHGDTFRITVKNLGDPVPSSARSRSARACSPRARSGCSPTRAARRKRRC
jgi:predicted ferric reductase